MDKVKAIPTTISSRFHREKKSSIVINGDTTYSSGNFEIDENYNVDIDTSINSNELNESNEGVNDSDLLRLEELNEEINAILASGSNENSKEELDENNTVEIIVEPEPDIIVEPEPDIIKNSGSSSNLSEIIGEVLNNGNNDVQQEISSNQSNNSQTTTQVNTSTILTEQQWGDCAEAGLTVQDCEDLVRDFWNYN